MFHLLYPRRRGFFTWEELGCLCRALGYPAQLFEDHLTEEIATEGDGLSISEIMKMLDFNLLYNALHSTYNMHSAVWNMSAIRKSVHLLDHKAIGFEEINEIRLAYRIYEASDQKGMRINQNVLMRTIKMCGRTIAPMKLMHRLKHMRNKFEEPGRIQLHEFLDLILWCDLYESFLPDDQEEHKDKINDIFQFVDFETLLTHYDERLANKLNQKYLLEEWDFGFEKFNVKNLKDPPVYSDYRIRQTDGCFTDSFRREFRARAQNDKKSYRGLKSEVGDSQKRVYSAHAGYLRRRPVSAPDLSQYMGKEESFGDSEPPTAHCAYETLRKILQSNSAKGSRIYSLDMTERPQTCEYYRVSTPRAVKEEEISEIEKKIDSLLFNIETLDGRVDIDLNDEYNDFLPGYKEKLAKRPKVVAECKPRMKRTKTPSEEVINSLVYPKFRPLHSHSQTCDARYRGWHKAQTKSGSHFVLTSPQFENSIQGRLFSKLREQSQSEVKKVRGDFVYLNNKRKNNTVNRPITAPGILENKNFDDSIASNYSLGSADNIYSNGENKILEAWTSTPRECFPDFQSHNLSHDSGFTECADEGKLEYELKAGNDLEKMAPLIGNTNENNTNISQQVVGKPNPNKKERQRYQSSPGNVDEYYDTQIVEMKGIGKIKLLANIAETDCPEDEQKEEPEPPSLEETGNLDTSYFEQFKIRHHKPSKKKPNYQQQLKKFLASVNKDVDKNRPRIQKGKLPHTYPSEKTKLSANNHKSQNMCDLNISSQSGTVKQKCLHNVSVSNAETNDANLSKDTGMCTSSDNTITSMKKQNQNKYSRIAKRFKGEIPKYLSKRLMSGAS